MSRENGQAGGWRQVLPIGVFFGDLAFTKVPVLRDSVNDLSRLSFHSSQSQQSVCRARYYASRFCASGFRHGLFEYDVRQRGATHVYHCQQSQWLWRRPLHC